MSDFKLVSILGQPVLQVVLSSPVLSAGTLSQVTGTVSFADSNGVSWGLQTDGKLTASIGGVPSPVNFSAGTQSANLGSIVFGDSGNISFGLSNGTITASFAGGGGGMSTHNSAYHSGNIIPAAVQDFGNFAFSLGTAALPAASAGRLGFYGFAEGGNTRFGMITPDGTEVTHAQDTFVIVTNDSGSTLNVGEVVYCTSGGGSVLHATRARANATSTMPAIGIVAESIANGAQGRVQIGGILTGFATNMFSEGDTLYVSPTVAGALTNVVPSYPNLKQRVAVVRASLGSTNGIILVQIVGVQGDYGVQALSAGTQNATSGQVVFANSNGLSFGMSGSSQVTGSYTVPTVTQFFSNTATTFNGTNISGSMTLNTNGLRLDLSAAAGGGGGAAISAGANSQNTGTVNFSNANGVTFGLSNNGVMTASVAAAGGAQTGISGISAGTQMQTVGTMQFVNSNGISFGMSNSSQVTASYTVPNVPAQTQQPMYFSAANGSGSASTMTFANSNGVSFSTGTQGVYATVATNYQSQGAYLTTARASNDAIGLNTALTANGVSVTANSSGLSLNFPAFLTSQSNQAVSGANGSFTFQTITFANSNGVSFSTGTQGLYATVATNYQSQGAYLTTARASNDAIGLNTAQTNVTWTVNSSGLSLNAGGYAGTLTGFTGANISATITHNTAGLSLNMSVAAPGGGAFSAGNSTDGLGTTGLVGNQIVFFEGANITLSQSINGGSASLSIVGAAGGGGGYTALTYQNRQLGASSALGLTNNVIWMVPMRIQAPVSASTIQQMLSFGAASTAAGTGQVGVTLDMALYENTAATNLSRMDSIWSSQYLMTIAVSSNTSFSYSINGGASGQTISSSSNNINMNSQFNGLRMLTFNLNSTLDTGLYCYAFRVSTSSAVHTAALRTFQAIFDNPLPAAMAVGFGGSTNSTIGYNDGGTYGTTSGAMPASFLLSDIKQTVNLMPYVKIGAI